MHTRFDRGYLSVDRKYRLLVSTRLRDEFGNGAEFYARQGQAINPPRRTIDLPTCPTPSSWSGTPTSCSSILI